MFDAAYNVKQQNFSLVNHVTFETDPLVSDHTEQQNYSSWLCHALVWHTCIACLGAALRRLANIDLQLL